MTRTLIDIHILQTVPPSNINRDDTSSPKMATYGGVRRARVSSQAWKRATRLAFDHYLDSSDLGVRTKRVVELLAAEITTRAPELADNAVELAAATVQATGIKIKASGKDTTEESGYLVFLSKHQVANLAAAAIEASGSDDVSKALNAANVKHLANRDHSVDLALFGRMVADQTDLNVDAAAQVAHAISVHPVETEFDYYTAVDDLNPKDQSGAAMIGIVEFNSSTLYRYATLDANRLADTLGSTIATQRAVEAFLQSFTRSMPTGKQNTFANRTLPEAILVMVRPSQPINLVGAFENPVHEREPTGRIKAATDALRDEAREIERAYDEHPVATWVTRVGADTASLDDLGPNVPLAQLVTELGALVGSRLDQQS